MKTDFEQRIRSALADAELGQSFRSAMDFLRGKRSLAVESVSHWDALKQQGQAIRQYSLQHLPDLLEQLETQCRKNGIQVHWAEDGDAANRLILDIAQAQDARRIVKGKSMATEEIGLNAFLASHNIRSIESDMGEYIVQLAGETPSHIIMPAIHKTREQIAHLFQDKLHVDADANDVDQLIGIGRSVLREHFAQADIGISGVNFAVAETGTLCLVENEGNGRLSTTAPATHIAVMGLEKVIARMQDLPPLQSLLTRSATGQATTTYLNLINGPRRSGERDGPKQVHLIILDNGRSAMHAHPDLQETLACIRCGACMNHCPVYSRIGGHAYGSTYPGPIGQVVTPQMQGIDKAGELLDACSLNGACGEACPVGIDLPGLIRKLRQLRQQQSGERKDRVEALVWKLWQFIHRHPAVYRFVTKTLGALHSTLHRRLHMHGLAPRGWTQSRLFPKAANQTLHTRMAKRQARHVKEEQAR